MEVSDIWPEWRAEELIGRGSYGEVYRASRTEMGHVSTAAVKIIEIPRDDSEVRALSAMGLDALSIRGYFQQTARSIIGEIEAMEKLKGAPNVVAIEDYKLVERDGDAGWTICIRMELLEGLAGLYPGPAAPLPREVARIGADVCAALAACEGRGIIHRDVKPDNVFLSPFGAYKLGDFGVARRIDEGSSSALSQRGTVPYMAPEVVRGERYDSRVDTYSLGIMMYRYLNGMRFPFLPATGAFSPADSEAAQLRRLRGDDVPAPPAADPALAAVVLRACQPDPARRYLSAAAMRADLLAWLEGRAPEPEPAPRPAPRPRPEPESQPIQEPAATPTDAVWPTWLEGGPTPAPSRGPIPTTQPVKPENPPKPNQVPPVTKSPTTAAYQPANKSAPSSPGRPASAPFRGSAPVARPVQPQNTPRPSQSPPTSQPSEDSPSPGKQNLLEPRSFQIIMSSVFGFLAVLLLLGLTGVFDGVSIDALFENLVFVVLGIVCASLPFALLCYAVLRGIMLVTQKDDSRSTTKASYVESSSSDYFKD